MFVQCSESSFFFIQGLFLFLGKGFPLAYNEFWGAFTTLIESDEAIKKHIQICRSISVTRFDVGVVQILDCHSQIEKAENICLILDSRKAAEDALRDI